VEQPAIVVDAVAQQGRGFRQVHDVDIVPPEAGAQLTRQEQDPPEPLIGGEGGVEQHGDVHVGQRAGIPPGLGAVEVGQGDVVAPEERPERAPIRFREV